MREEYQTFRRRLLSVGVFSPHADAEESATKRLVIFGPVPEPLSRPSLRVSITLILLLVVGVLGGWWHAAASTGWTHIASLPGHTAPIISVDLSDDGRYAATLDADHGVTIWDVPRRTALARLPAGAVRVSPATADAATVSVDPAGHGAAFSTPQAGTWVWDARTAKLARLDGPTLWATQLAVAVEADVAAAPWSDGTLASFRTSDGERLALYQANPLLQADQVTYLGLLLDGSFTYFIYSGFAPPRAMVSATGEYDVRGGFESLVDTVQLRYREHEQTFRAVAVDYLLTADEAGIKRILKQRYVLSVRDLNPTLDADGHRVWSSENMLGETRRLIDIPVDLSFAIAADGHHLAVLRPSVPADMIRYPQAWAFFTLLLLLPVWIVVLLHTRQRLPPDPSLASEPLPRPARWASGAMVILGGLAIVTSTLAMIITQACMFDLTGPLLLWLGYQLHYHRRNRARLGSLVILWPVVPVCGLLLGEVLGHGPVEFRVGGDVMPLSAGTARAVTAGMAVLLLALIGWSLWALTLPRTVAVCRASRFRTTGIGHTRRCRECGYDLRGILSGGSRTCPECGTGSTAPSE